jgi:ribonucleoside-diphosphate reductase alpha chain
MTRQRLPNRRLTETFDLTSGYLAYTASIGRFDDGRLAEIFITNHKAGSAADTNAKDAAVVCSIALQHGVPLETIRHALMRDSHGRASGPLGEALDMIAAEGPGHD